MKRLELVPLLSAFLLSASLAQVPVLSPIVGATADDIVKGFGPRLHPLLNTLRSHNGADFKVPVGTDVLATAAGRVADEGRSESYGVYVVIDHAEGYQTFYAHLSKSIVRRGQMVEAAAKIAESGDSGLTSVPGLHYEILKDKKHLDPKTYIRASR